MQLASRSEVLGWPLVKGSYALSLGRPESANYVSEESRSKAFWKHSGIHGVEIKQMVKVRMEDAAILCGRLGVGCGG